MLPPSFTAVSVFEDCVSEVALQGRGALGRETGGYPTRLGAARPAEETKWHPRAGKGEVRGMGNHPEAPAHPLHRCLVASW